MTYTENISLMKITILCDYVSYHLFIYLGFYTAFNTVEVISRWVVGRAEETSTYSSLGLCTVNCRPTASNYQLSHLRPCGDRTISFKYYFFVSGIMRDALRLLSAILYK